MDALEKTLVAVITAAAVPVFFLAVHSIKMYRARNDPERQAQMKAEFAQAEKERSSFEWKLIKYGFLFALVVIVLAFCVGPYGLDLI